MESYNYIPQIDNSSKELKDLAEDLAERYPGRVPQLPYHQIAQSLDLSASVDPKDHNVTFNSWSEIFDFQSKKDGANYTKLKAWLEKHFEIPTQKKLELPNRVKMH